MKRLILMRHAKSSWSDPEQKDIDRPLNKRGLRDAPAMGKWLAGKGYMPDQALVSSAKRTQETWCGVTSEIPDCLAEFQPQLYQAGPAAMMTALQGAPATAESLLMIGHQPGIGDFARRLLAMPPNDGDFDRYPTTATAIIDFKADAWSAIAWNSGTLKDFIIPRNLT
ncbi:histidine phosphatase family protein [Rhodobacteraceae bacterium DSL-40]|uniref:SixA phosphatase family protein n=1 Tax=Amaricoccus sp. B4 TaxID=3368557 RepID=UPI000DAE0F53